MCAAAAGAAVAVALAAAFLGPVVSEASALGTWIASAGIALVLFAWQLRHVQRVRGADATRLLTSVEPTLPSRARSTLELHHGQLDDGTDASLVAAHARAVHQALAPVPVRRIVPWRWLAHGSVLGSLVLIAGAAAFWVAAPRVRTGIEALLNPAYEGPDGRTSASIVASTRARLVYPSYLSRASTTLSDPTEIEAPRGTAVHLELLPLVNAERGMLQAGDRELRLSRRKDGWWHAEVVVREDTTLRAHLHDGSSWLRDSDAIRVVAVNDDAPRVKLQSPRDGQVVDLDQEVGLAFQAQDDGGIVRVDWRARLADGTEVRRPLWKKKGETAPRKAQGEGTLLPRELGAKPGDTLLLWLEAKDGDVVSGPNLGVSATHTLEIRTPASERSMHLSRLSNILEAVVHGLGDRLELPPPSARQAAQRRFDRLRDGTMAWLHSLQRVVSALAEQTTPLTDLEQLREIHRRVRSLLAREAALYEAEMAPEARRARLDQEMVSELETDALLLDDLLGQARLQDAAELARELQDARQRLAQLLDDLKESDTPEARRAVLAEIARAERRLEQLAQKLATMSRKVPSEFVNTEALPRKDASSALEALRNAVKSGDLEQAQEQLSALSERLDSLAEGLTQADHRFSRARFGRQRRALSQASDRLQMLAKEQERLADRSDAVRKKAAERAAEQNGAEDIAQRLAPQAQNAQQALETIDRDALGSFEQETYDRVEQRLRDTRDALRSGDLSEARRMADEAARDLNDLAQGLGMDARMFPGHQGERRQQARRARGAASRMHDLQRALEQSTPQSASMLEESERRQLEHDVEAQRKARDAAGKLAERFSEGPEGTPVSPDAARTLRDVQRQMRDAEKSLQEGNAREASSAQHDAAQRLESLQQRLQERLQRKGSSGDGGGGGTAAGRRQLDAPVKIPDADEHVGPMEMRRKVLDAMREDGPRGYEGAVKQYYQELLR